MPEDTTCPENGQPSTFASAFADVAREVGEMRETAKREIFPMLLQKGVDVAEADRQIVLAFLDDPDSIKAIVAGLSLLSEVATDSADFSRLLRSHGQRFVNYARFSEPLGYAEPDAHSFLVKMLETDSAG